MKTGRVLVSKLNRSAVKTAGVQEHLLWGGEQNHQEHKPRRREKRLESLRGSSKARD